MKAPAVRSGTVRCGRKSPRLRGSVHLVVNGRRQLRLCRRILAVHYSVGAVLLHPVTVLWLELRLHVRRPRDLLVLPRDKLRSRLLIRIYHKLVVEHRARNQATRVERELLRVGPVRWLRAREVLGIRLARTSGFKPGQPPLPTEQRYGTAHIRAGRPDPRDFGF